MAHGRNRYQSRENRAKVGQVLMQNWDPIGVKDPSGPKMNMTPMLEKHTSCSWVSVRQRKP